ARTLRLGDGTDLGQPLGLGRSLGSGPYRPRAGPRRWRTRRPDALLLRHRVGSVRVPVRDRRTALRGGPRGDGYPQAAMGAPARTNDDGLPGDQLLGRRLAGATPGWWLGGNP